MSYKYNCLLILPEKIKQFTLIADKIKTENDMSTKFYKATNKQQADLWGTETVYNLIAQYPTDKLVIESIEEASDEL